MNRDLSCWLWIVAGVLCAACGARDSLYDGRGESAVGGESLTASGTSSTGGKTFMAGGGAFVVTTGGHNSATGGAVSSGGAISTGGVPSQPTGGAKATGGATVKATGGAIATGGALAIGGATSIPAGGTSSTGGANTTGGAASGGASAAGGTIATGSTTTPASGGATATGGATALQTGGTNSIGGTTALATAGAGTGGSSMTIRSCILHVTTSGTGTNDGSAWAAAFANVQPAITAGTNLVNAAACSSVEVWVAAGTYKPTYLTDSTDPRTATFQLATNVALYGGFVGTESARSARDFNGNLTTLSGDIGAANDTSDNSYHVVTGATGATIDGFTITGGMATGSIMNNSYDGGGMWNSSAAPKVMNCMFSGNSASGRGGGMYNYGGSPTVVNCTFLGNSSFNFGGGMYNSSSSPTVTNCRFLGNQAGYGGGMCNFGVMSSLPTVTNCTFSGNSATYGGGIWDHNTAPIVLNSILWGDSVLTSGPEIYCDPDSGFPCGPIVTYSIVAGYPGIGNLNVDPMLNADLTLQPGSPAIDSGGCGAAVPATDILGNPRWDIASLPNATGSYGVDIGAYEYQGVTGTDALITNVACP